MCPCLYPPPPPFSPYGWDPLVPGFFLKRNGRKEEKKRYSEVSGRSTEPHESFRCQYFRRNLVAQMYSEKNSTIFRGFDGKSLWRVDN